MSEDRALERRIHSEGWSREALQELLEGFEQCQSALRFYANPAAYAASSNGFLPIERDGGAIARLALTESET